MTIDIVSILLRRFKLSNKEVFLSSGDYIFLFIYLLTYYTIS